MTTEKPNKPERRSWFLTPEIVDAWEHGVRRRLKRRLVGIGIVFLASFATLAILSPWLERQISPTPKQAQVSQPAVSDQDADTIFNNFVHSFADTKNQYEAKKAAHIGDIADLYSASSFCNSREGARLTKALTALVEMDRQYDQAVHELPNKALAAANKAGVEMSARVSGTFDMQMDLADFLAALDESQAAEDEWVRNTVELYQFSEKHAGSIVATHDQLTFADSHIKSQFNAQFSKCLNSLAQVRAAHKKLNAVQEADSKKRAARQTSVVK